MSAIRTTLICALLAAVGPMSLSLYTPAMPEIARAFGSTELVIRLSVSIYFAGFAAAQLICGPLSDGFGRRPILLIFTVIYLLVGVVALLAPNVTILVGARLCQGIGAAAGIAISRAIVRDMFEGDRAAGMLAIIGTVLAIGPALAPFLGGIIMEWSSWHAVFLLMLGLGLLTLLVSAFSLPETAPPTGSFPLRQLFGAYGTLLSSPYFVSAALVVAGTQGAIYAQASILSFILIGRAGLTPAEFGLAMLMQTGSFIAGSLLARMLLGSISGSTLMPVGLALCSVSSILLIALALTQPPSVLVIMGPVAIFSFGIAFTLPTGTSAVLTPFPQMAGSASAMLGFLQMGAGLLGGLFAAAFSDTVAAMVVVVPGMTAIGVLSWLFWRRLTPPRLPLLQQPETALVIPE